MKNEELRMKNWDCFGFASQSSTHTGESECFMIGHKNFGDACGSKGGKAAQFFILHS